MARVRGLDERLQCSGVEVEGPGLDLGEDRLCPGPQDRLHGGEVGEARRHHLGARPHAECHQGEPERLRAGAHTDTEPRSSQRGDFGLESRGLGTEHELPGTQHAQHRGLDVRPDLRPLRCEIQHGNS